MRLRICRPKYEPSHFAHPSAGARAFTYNSNRMKAVCVEIALAHAANTRQPHTHAVECLLCGGAALARNLQILISRACVFIEMFRALRAIRDVDVYRK